MVPAILEGVIPILRVSSLAASLDYYVQVLGFTIRWHDPGVMASVGRDRCEIFLCAGDQGHPGGWIWIGATDVDLLVEEYRAAGATIRHPPTNYPWAYEMQVQDPDGNILRFGSEPKRDVRYGEWRDMRGDLWEMAAQGGWRRARTEIR
jgi:predicted enzyme related to lactoylglutathione lyase